MTQVMVQEKEGEALQRIVIGYKVSAGEHIMLPKSVLEADNGTLTSASSSSSGPKVKLTKVTHNHHLPHFTAFIHYYYYCCCC
jgi:hypothetical protein